MGSSLRFVGVVVATFVWYFLLSSALGSPIVNILHVTDVHGWVLGHPHEPHLNADFGDFASLVEHMQANAQAAGEDLFLFDSGDLIEGTGLSDATPVHGQYIFPAVKLVHNYNALTMGNHDIGHANVVALMQKAFIPYWNGTYLTSNSLDKATKNFLGAPYSTFTSPIGTKVVVLGYLYNFTQQANTTIVIPVSVSLLQPYFKEAMTAAADADLVVVCMHIDPESPPELEQIYAAIRKAHPNKPLALLSGHRHIKYFQRFDQNAFTIESGKYFEVLGKVRFELANGQINDLQYDWINTTRENFYKMANKNSENFLTPRGEFLKKFLTDAYNKLGLNKTLGCSPMTYSPYVEYQDKDSLFRLYVEDIVPDMIYNVSLDNPFFMANDGTLRYDLYSGRVAVNDMFNIMPFKDSFWYFRLTGKQLDDVIHFVDSNPQKVGLGRTPYVKGNGIEISAKNKHLIQDSNRFYYSSTPINPGVTYTLVLAEYDAVIIGRALRSLFPSEHWQPVRYPTPLSSTDAVMAYVSKFMPCSSVCRC